MNTLAWRTLPYAPASGTRLCRLSDLPEHGGCLFWFGPEEGKRFGLIAVRSGQQVLAYVNRCAHFGVPLAQTEQHLILEPGKNIVCNVHYARYKWQDGSCDFGDCDGEGLISVPLIIDGEHVIVGGEPEVS